MGVNEPWPWRSNWRLWQILEYLRESLLHGIVLANVDPSLFSEQQTPVSDFLPMFGRTRWRKVDRYMEYDKRGTGGWNWLTECSSILGEDTLSHHCIRNHIASSRHGKNWWGLLDWWVNACKTVTMSGPPWSAIFSPEVNSPCRTSILW